MKNTIIVTLLIVLISGCGPAYYLKRAKVNLKKAEQLGADIKNDTTYKTIRFRATGIGVKFEPRIITERGLPMIFTKDSVITKVVIKKGKDLRDTIYVETKCPDRIIEKSVPISVDQTITAKSGLPWWVYLIGGLLLVTVVFQAVRR